MSCGLLRPLHTTVLVICLVNRVNNEQVANTLTSNFQEEIISVFVEDETFFRLLLLLVVGQSCFFFPSWR